MRSPIFPKTTLNFLNFIDIYFFITSRVRISKNKVTSDEVKKLEALLGLAASFDHPTKTKVFTSIADQVSKFNDDGRHGHVV